MTANKTQPTPIEPASFIAAVEDETKRADSFRLLELMGSITGAEPVMWGPTMIGFGTYHYQYDSGREGDFFLTGFSPRKTALTLYIMAGFSRYDDLMARLGKFKTGKSCLYVKRLADVDEEVLKELITESIQYMRATYETR